MIPLRSRATLAQRIDAVLPQTQCRQCGFSGCMPYAEAIARAEAGINRCPPGGARVIRKIAGLTARPVIPLDSACGTHKPRHAALIDETRCIGCTLCIRACPVDAIVGAPRLMHTVIAGQCTGCELCLPPCPVDCIALVPAPWTPIDRLLARPSRAAKRARARFGARHIRLERERSDDAERLARRNHHRIAATGPAATPEERKQAIVAAALVRARRRLADGENARGPSAA